MLLLQRIREYYCSLGARRRGEYLALNARIKQTRKVTQLSTKVLRFWSENKLCVYSIKRIGQGSDFTQSMSSQPSQSCLLHRHASNYLWDFKLGHPPCQHSQVLYASPPSQQMEASSQSQPLYPSSQKKVRLHGFPFRLFSVETPIDLANISIRFMPYVNYPAYN